MSGIRKPICTTLARSRVRYCATASLTALLFLATSGVASAEKKFHRDDIADTVKSYDARMVRDPYQMAASRDGSMPDATSTAILEGRMDDVAMIATLSRYTLLDAPMASNREVTYREPRSSFSRLPEPDGWTAVAATLALGMFFFLRRVA